MAIKQPVSLDDLYPGRFLKAGNFHGKPVTLTIRAVPVHEELEGEDGKKVKVILSFNETEMQHVLPKTNALCIAAMFGKDLSKWVGRKVTFFPGEWKGEPAIRVWGSPEITADQDVTIKLPKRKPFAMRMHRVDRAAPAGTVQPDPPKA